MNSGLWDCKKDRNKFPGSKNNPESANANRNYHVLQNMRFYLARKMRCFEFQGSEFH